MKLSQSRRPRIVPLLVGLFYAVVSFGIVFEHNHHGDDDGVIKLLPSSVTMRASAAPLGVKLSRTPDPRHSGPCAACEWQAANVSPAIAAITPIPPALTTTDVAFATPTCLHLRVASTPSRAPPAA